MKKKAKKKAKKKELAPIKYDAHIKVDVETMKKPRAKKKPVDNIVDPNDPEAKEHWPPRISVPKDAQVVPAPYPTLSAFNELKADVSRLAVLFGTWAGEPILGKAREIVEKHQGKVAAKKLFKKVMDKPEEG